jgi:hypothetical protein
MKHAHVGPLLKKPSLDKEVLSNNRPISNVTFLSKILEKVVACRIKDHLHQHHLYEPYQSAYRSHHSTRTALLKVHNDLLMALDNKCAASLVLLDLLAAFDTVDHQILISRLRNHSGIKRTALKWLISYLSNHTQSIMDKGSSSFVFKLTTGI